MVWFLDPDTRPVGVWSGVSTAKDLRRGGQRGIEARDRAVATVAAQPWLADRMNTHPSQSARSLARTKPALDVTGNRETRQALGDLASSVHAAGGRALVVGGAVRDALIAGRSGRIPKGADVDVEVFGIAPEQLASMLSARYKVEETGKAFSVFKLSGLDIDVSLPRREVKTGTGHRAFSVEPDPFLSIEAAAQRRDFTINAMSLDPITGELVDVVGGLSDLEAGLLRHVGPAFAEDPLRVLRGAQFIARFDLHAHSSTIALARQLRAEASTLPHERIWGETEKLVVSGRRPGAGLHFLDDCDWIDVFPEIAALKSVAQDPQWHPEGDVFVHTAHVMDAYAAMRVGDEHEDLVVGLACLCHDFGKPGTTEYADGRWRAHAHEAAGVEPTEAFLTGLAGRPALALEVVPLVKYHLAPVTLYREQSSDAAVRRLANKVGRIDRLVRVAHADQAGRPPLTMERFEAGEWLLERAAQLNIATSKVEPLVRGRDLLEHLALEPGPKLGQLLKTLFDAQVAGEFSTLDEGLVVARRITGS